MFINRPLREVLAKYENFLAAGFNRKNPRAIELLIETLQATFEVNRLFAVPFCWPTAMNLNVAVTIVVPCSQTNPWAPPASGWREGYIVHIKRAVYDVTTANTQLVVGTGLTTAQCAPVTLLGLVGYAGDVDFWIPPGFYCGLRGTNNVGDIARDLTLFGECIPLGVNGFDYGGNFYEFNG